MEQFKHTFSVIFQICDLAVKQIKAFQVLQILLKIRKNTEKLFIKLLNQVTLLWGNMGVWDKTIRELKLPFIVVYIGANSLCMLEWKTASWSVTRLSNSAWDAIRITAFTLAWNPNLILTWLARNSSQIIRKALCYKRKICANACTVMVGSFFILICQGSV